MTRRLSKLPPGTRFHLAEMPEITGTLVKASEARAVVRLDRPEREVEFVDQNGEPRQFRCRGAQVTSWAPTTVVETVGFETLNDEESDMSKKKATKQPKSTKAGRDSAAAALTCANFNNLFQQVAPPVPGQSDVRRLGRTGGEGNIWFGGRGDSCRLWEFSFFVSSLAARASVVIRSDAKPNHARSPVLVN